VVEFTAALPRAKLFSNWQIVTNDELALRTLGSAGFDPHQTVLVADPIPALSTPDTNQFAGTVDINPNFKSKRIGLTADVKLPSVLMLTEKFNRKWQVWVDGKLQPLLRCNFVMRGVYLQPGKHDIVFRYVPPRAAFWISLATVAAGLILCAWMAVTGLPPDRTAEERSRSYRSRP
jgi:hypothetical protein